MLVGGNKKMVLVVKSCTVSVAISWIRSLITSRRLYRARASIPQGTLLGPVFFFGLHYVVSVPNSFVASRFLDRFAWFVLCLFLPFFKEELGMLFNILILDLSKRAQWKCLHPIKQQKWTTIFSYSRLN